MTCPKVTVAVCTYARPASLRMAIDSLLAQTFPKRDFEILVVDNTAAPGGLAELQTRYPSSDLFTWCHEPVPGLSRARNLAVRMARGEILAFIDDDARVRSDWLTAMVNAFEAFGPRAEAVGGRVELIWTRPRPTWLHDDLLGFLSMVNWGGTRRTVQRDEWIAGTNMAFRTAALRTTNGFSEGLGRRGGGALLSNEEQELLDRIRGRGGWVAYAPEMCVDHTVGSERLTQPWFRKRAAWQAISDYMCDGDALDRDLPTHWSRLAQFSRSIGERDTLVALHRAVEDAALFRDQLYAIYDLTILSLAGFKSS